MAQRDIDIEMESFQGSVWGGAMEGAGVSAVGEGLIWQGKLQFNNVRVYISRGYRSSIYLLQHTEILSGKISEHNNMKVLW